MPKIGISLPGATGSWNISGQGIIQEAFSINASDIKFHVYAGTSAFGEDGLPLEHLYLDRALVYGNAPSGLRFIGVFDFRPSGAVFHPGVRITLKYNPGDIPLGMDEDDLQVWYYNEITENWESFRLVPTVNAGDHTVTFTTDHFSQYALAFQQPTLIHTHTSNTDADDIPWGFWLAVGIMATLIVVFVTMIIIVSGRRSR
jgi:hypothetical protein